MPVDPGMDRVAVHEISSEAMALDAATVIAAAAVPPAGLNRDAWAWMLGQRLARSRQLWQQYGVALDGETVAGVVLIKLCGDNAANISCAEACCRVGCCSSIRSVWGKRAANDVFINVENNMVYVERLAVHPAYQRKRIASKLLDWTEQKGLELLMERFPETLRTQGSRLIAEVGVDNAAGVACFEHQGYLCSGRSAKGSGCPVCLGTQCALGHTGFVVMTKRLSAAYQRAVQQPVKYTGSTVIVHVPDPEEPMTRE